MNIDFHLLNQTFEALTLKFEEVVGVVTNYALFFRKEVAEVTNSWTWSWNIPIETTPLQLTLFKVLFFLLLITAGLIGYSWRIYGKAITEKFVRQSTLKEIEELKLSVAKLKLPKEHTPRI